MSTRRVQASALGPRRLSSGSAVVPWTRNPSWAALTPVGDSEQRFRGLVAVFPQGSYLALSAAGDYTVDWGDGSSDNVNTGVTALKLYDFNDADLAGTDAPVKLTDSGDLVERVDKDNNDVAHGYSNGMEVRFYNIVSTTGLTTAQVYYVINATANNFQVTTKAGDATQIVALTTNGSATLLPYKQAIVNVTPQAEQNLTTLNLNVKHTATGLQAYETGWLDIEIGSPNFTGITLGATAVQVSMCERVAVRNIGSITSFSSLLQNYRALKEVVITASTSAVTNTSNMFQNCSSLVIASLFDTAAVTNMTSMFQTCTALTTLPLFNTVAVTTMTNMFNGCSALPAVPLFNTVSVTSMNGMFTNCRSLTGVPLFNTVAVTNMANMFEGCLSLSSLPLFNMAAVTSVSSMFAGCIALATVPPFNTVAVTNMSFMFFNCTSFATVPLFNTAAVTNMAEMFRNCVSLLALPLYNTAAVTNTSRLIENCPSLSSVPALNVSAVSSSANFSLMFNACPSLSRVEAKNFRFTFSVANCKLGATELNEIYTNLPTVTGQTITVSNNVGTAGDDPTIATAKGWTVTG